MTAGFILVGLAAGVLSGLIGLGGGIVMVPALVVFYGFSQHLAQGTTLAVMIPPIGILAAYTYYQKGYVDISAAALICIGFVLGGLIGAKVATSLSSETLRRVFGIVIVLIGIRMIIASR